MGTERRVKPMSPDEITDTKEDLIPDEVIESFNEMIVEKWDGTKSFFRQKEIVSKIKKKMGLHSSSKKIFENNWLDVEKIYEELGWVVRYESPDRGTSSFEEYFKFSKREG